jgi:transposase
VRLAASGQTPQAIATAVGVCPRTVRKWLKRYREEGLAGLFDRSSRPPRPNGRNRVRRETGKE